MKLSGVRILLIPMILWLFLNFVWAKTDCEIFWALSYSQPWTNGFSVADKRETEDNDYSKFLDITTQRKIIKKDDLDTALLNLKKYCCENELWWLSQNSQTCKADETFFNKNALDSQYLFDHIFDVMMRRLNGLTGDTNIYIETNMTEVDDKWKERRDWISGKATDLSWANPQEIIDKYNVYWSKSDPQIWYDITEKVYTTFNMSDVKFLEYVSGQWKTEDSESVARAIKDYDKRTLYDRYVNVCALSQYFYALLDVWQGSSDKYKVVERLSDWKLCDQVIKQQIDGERQYVEWVEMESSNLYLSNYIEWYLWYLYNRWNKMKSLWRDSVDRFLDVVRAVPHLVNQCVK